MARCKVTRGEACPESMIVMQQIRLARLLGLIVFIILGITSSNHNLARAQAGFGEQTVAADVTTTPSPRPAAGVAGGIVITNPAAAKSPPTITTPKAPQVNRPAAAAADDATGVNNINQQQDDANKKLEETVWRRPSPPPPSPVQQQVVIQKTPAAAAAAAAGLKDASPPIQPVPSALAPPPMPSNTPDIPAAIAGVAASANTTNNSTSSFEDVLKNVVGAVGSRGKPTVNLVDTCLPLIVNVQDLNVLATMTDTVMLGNETSPFCPCTALPSWNWTNIDNWPLAFLRCPAGYRCSRRAYDAALQNANSSHIAASIAQAQDGLDSKYGLCIPCVIGEYCEAGTVELSSAQIAECHVVGQQLAVEYTGTNQTSNGGRRRRLLATSQQDGSAARQFSAQCTSLRPCPPGTFCPNPALKAACSEGAFCSSTSTKPETCNITDALQQNPLLVLQDEPEFLYQRAANGRVSLGGNLCPINASSPFQKCPPGSYCPNPVKEVRCPARFYCPEGSSKPLKCGLLFDCPPGSASPNIGWLGISSLALLCLACITLVRVFSLRKARRLARQQHDDNLLLFMSSMGFRVNKRVDNYNYFTWNFIYALPICGKPSTEAVIQRTMSTKSVGGAAPVAQTGSSKDLLGTNPAARVPDSAPLTPEGILTPAEEYGDITPKLTMSFENLSLKLTTGSYVLKGVSGIFPHSQLHGVMGPSGCGKTSLMNALCGKAQYGFTSGRVEVTKERARGEPEVTTVERVRHITGYVPQEDILHTTLTVSENLMFAAKLRQPKDWNKDDLRRISQIVLELLGLSHVETCIVGSMERRGISGGQRKRVNIGIELVAKPSLLCLDEPTSGLDAAVSHDIITALKEMAGKGMNVIMVVHQPRYSIFEMFHSVMLLGVGGRTVYLGPTHSALTYFQRVGFPLPQNENPADFYLDVISGAVKRKGDPDFVPDHLFDFWEAKGAGWLQKHMAAGDKKGSPDTSDIKRKKRHHRSARMPVSPENAPITSQKGMVSHLSRGDLPWRPKDLQAISNHFNMLDINGDGYLSFEEFKQFWSGLSRMLNKEQYRAFLEQMIFAFEIDENGIITYEDFMSKMKSRLILLNDSREEEDEEMGFNETMSIHSSCSISLYRTNSRQKEMVERLVQGQGRMGERSPGQKRRRLASLVRGIGSNAAAGISNAQFNVRSHINAFADIKTQRGLLPRFWEATKTELHSAYAVSVGAQTGGRQLPSLWRQIHIVFNRSFAKWLNNWDIMMSDMLLLALLGGLIALIQGNYSKISKLPPRIIMALTAFSVPISITGLRSFSFDNVIFLQRESQGGLCTVAYMLGRMFFDFVDMLVRPVMFMAFYYSIVWPRAQVKDYYVVLLSVAWYCYGFGYLASVLFDKQFAMVAAAAVPLVLGAVINGNDPQPVAKVEKYEPLWWLYGLSYARWGTEALMIKEALVGYVDQAQSPIIYGLFSTQGYCQLQKLNLTDSRIPASTNNTQPSHPSFMTQARDKFISQQGDSELSPLKGMLHFYQGYPENLETRCDPYFMTAVGWMFALGVIVRLITIILMKIKVMSHAQK